MSEESRNCVIDILAVFDDILLSMVDRCGIEYHTVICKMCGLIRGKKYLRNVDVKDFYKNYYNRQIISELEKLGIS